MDALEVKGEITVFGADPDFNHFTSRQRANIPDTQDYYTKAHQERQEAVRDFLREYPLFNVVAALEWAKGPVEERVICQTLGLTPADLAAMLYPYLEKGTVGTSTHKWSCESILRGRRYYFWLGK